MSATLSLVFGVAACGGTLLATVRVLHPAELTAVYMMTSWLVGELALFHLVLQAVAVALFVRFGALHEATGLVGIVLFGVSIIGLVAVQFRAADSVRTFERGLLPVLGLSEPGRVGHRLGAPAPPPRWQVWVPFWFGHRGVEVVRNISYGDQTKHNLLDVYRPSDPAAGAPLPVVIYIHGGAWVIGNKEQQGKPLLLHLARRGYIGVTINYRLAPRHRWPAQIVDVKRAIVWVREHIAEYGGDPHFIAVAGSSAGGHLAALAALTPGDPTFQPGFEQEDASVDACVPIYGPFDLTDGSGIRGRAALRRFLEPMVMGTTLDADEAGWRAASPLWRVNSHAPPMFVIQGQLDVFVWREEARQFVDALGRCTNAPLVFVEVPGAQHAFEVFNSVRCYAAVAAICRFLDVIRCVD